MGVKMLKSLKSIERNVQKNSLKKKNQYPDMSLSAGEDDLRARTHTTLSRVLQYQQASR